MFNHAIDLRTQGYDKLATDAQRALEKITEEVARNTTLQTQIIGNMLDNAQINWSNCYEIINTKIRENGVVLSEATKTNLTNLDATNARFSSMATLYGNVADAADAFKNANNIANSSIVSTSNAAKDAVTKLGELEKAWKAVHTAATKATNAGATSVPTTAQKNSNVSTGTGGGGGGGNNNSAQAAKDAQKQKDIAAAEKVVASALAALNAAKANQEARGRELGQARANLEYTQRQINQAQQNVAKAKTKSKQKAALKIVTNLEKVMVEDMRKIDQVNALLAAANADVTNKQKAYNNAVANLDNIKNKKYAKGSRYISSDQIGITQEKGQEIVFRRSDGAMLTPLGRGDKVFTAEMTDSLWSLAKAMTKDGIKQNTADVNNVVNIKPTFNMDNSITINGNADSSTVDDIRDILDSRFDKWTKDLTEDFGMFGHKLRF